MKHFVIVIKCAAGLTPEGSERRLCPLYFIVFLLDTSHLWLVDYLAKRSLLNKRNEEKNNT